MVQGHAENDENDEPRVGDDGSRTLGGQIAGRLRQDILAGRLRPGSPLSQPVLSARYNTSRMPVRDAVRQMVSEGLAINARSGAFVATFTMDDVEDAFWLLATAHGRAVRRASLNATYVELSALTDVHRAMVEAEQRHDLEEVVRLTWDFHRSINRIARSPKLLAVIRTVAMSVPMNYLLEFPDDAARLVGEKGPVLDAMKERDVERAERLMTQHILDAGVNVRTYFLERGLLPGTVDQRRPRSPETKAARRSR